MSCRWARARFLGRMQRQPDMARLRDEAAGGSPLVVVGTDGRVMHDPRSGESLPKTAAAERQRGWFEEGLSELHESGQRRRRLDRRCEVEAGCTLELVQRF